MTVHESLSPRKGDARLDQIVKVAIYAVGGQGGGVLTTWIEDLARAQGYAAQATSVAGVSQRTGATIYYIEMAPATGQTPIFSLMPAAGDVDVMISAEWMEAGRAMIRGFVTPDRTTLIASTHRNLAVSEKIVPGDGLADAEAVREAAQQAAKRLIAADFEAVAVRANGSVISATLFGALAAIGGAALPARGVSKTAIRAGGKGVEAIACAPLHAPGMRRRKRAMRRSRWPQGPCPGRCRPGRPCGGMGHAAARAEAAARPGCPERWRWRDCARWWISRMLAYGGRVPGPAARVLAARDHAAHDPDARGVQIHRQRHGL
jgi:Pyruvate/2-oxoacid:ferredoxin oxidoreductase gamma subunit